MAIIQLCVAVCHRTCIFLLSLVGGQALEESLVFWCGDDESLEELDVSFKGIDLTRHGKAKAIHEWWDFASGLLGIMRRDFHRDLVKLLAIARVVVALAPAQVHDIPCVGSRRRVDRFIVLAVSAAVVFK